MPDFDILTAGFPCFVENTPIHIKNNIINIQDVIAGDNVLTHTGEYQLVNRTSKRIYNGKIYKITPRYGIKPITCTPEHPFYVVEKTNKGFSEPFWLNADKLNINKHFLVVLKDNYFDNNYEFQTNVKTSSTSYKTKKLKTNDLDFWFLVGFYVAEGYRNKKRKKDGRYVESWRTVLCCNEKEKDFILSKCKKVFGKGCLSKDRTCYKIHIIDQLFYEFLEPFGRGAINKIIPYELFSIKREFLESLIDGYFFGDGYYITEVVSHCTTISEKLIYSIQKLLTKLDGKIPSVVKNIRSPTYIIEDRIVNQNNVYVLTRRKTDKTTYQYVNNDYIYLRMKSVEEKSYKGYVYNLSVNKNESYTIENYIITHNCQTFSYAGKRMGFDDTRGTLFFEIARIAKEKRPKILFLENVKGLLNHNRGKTFGVILNTLYELGYDAEWQIFNSKYYVPQNRERVFIVGHSREKPTRKIFPIIEGDTRDLKTFEQTQDEGKWIRGPFSRTIDANYWKGGGSRTMILASHTKANIKQRIQNRDSTWTVDTSAGTKQYLIESDSKIRKLTPLECERLMGFPDKWTECNISDTQRYKMLGNSVVPLIIEMIGKRFI